MMAVAESIEVAVPMFRRVVNAFQLVAVSGGDGHERRW